MLTLNRTDSCAPVARDPFENLFHQLFGSEPDKRAVTQSDRTPLADISETDAAYELAFELPGLTDADIQVDVHDHTLTVTAERKDDRERQDRKWHRVEHRYGRYARTISLPRAASSENVDAVYENGVLTVTVPKTQEAQAKRIQVRSGDR